MPSIFAIGKKNALILIGAAVGVALLLFGGGLGTKESQPETPSYRLDEDELVQYQEHLEERVKALCQSVDGTASITVIVTLSGGFEEVYAVEEHDGYEEYVILGSGANAKALFLTRHAPSIAGIGIVCTGGDDPNLKRELTELVGAAFHVPSNRIHVTGTK